MQWFKHMGGMRRDPQIQRVIRKFGLRGYGLYNAIVETITDRLSSESPMPTITGEIPELAEDFAAEFNESPALIEEILEFMLAKRQHLVSAEYDGITCRNVYKYLQTSQTRSSAIQGLIKDFHNARAARLLMSQHATDSLNMSQHVLDGINGDNGGEKGNVSLNDEMSKHVLDKSRHVEQTRPRLRQEGSSKGSPRKISRLEEGSDWKEEE